MLVLLLVGRKSAFKILIGTPTGNRSLGSPRRRWQDNIKMDLNEIGTNTRNRVDSVQDKDYWNYCEFGFKPPGFISHSFS